MNKMSGNILEQTTLNRFESLGWQTGLGPDISPDGPIQTQFGYHLIEITSRSD